MQTLEIIGFIFGIGGVWLTIRKHIWCFPVGIVNVLITAWLVYHQALFADVLQQLVYFVLLVAGWMKWSRASGHSPVRVTTLGARESFSLAAVWLAGTAVMGYLFDTFTRASFPWWDSGATVLCFIAQWLIARRKIENWILWMIANPVYITLYLLKDLELYALLSLVYFIMAILGWRQWNGYLKRQPDAHA